MTLSGNLNNTNNDATTMTNDSSNNNIHYHYHYDMSTYHTYDDNLYVEKEEDGGWIKHTRILLPYTPYNNTHNVHLNDYYYHKDWVTSSNQQSNEQSNEVDPIKYTSIPSTSPTPPPTPPPLPTPPPPPLIVPQSMDKVDNDLDVISWDNIAESVPGEENVSTNIVKDILGSDYSTEEEKERDDLDDVVLPIEENVSSDFNFDYLIDVKTKYYVGEEVEYLYSGHWYYGVVESIDDSELYDIKFLNCLTGKYDIYSSLNVNLIRGLTPFNKGNKVEIYYKRYWYEAIITNESVSCILKPDVKYVDSYNYGYEEKNVEASRIRFISV
jgi:hypothetical protein